MSRWAFVRSVEVLIFPLLGTDYHIGVATLLERGSILDSHLQQASFR